MSTEAILRSNPNRRRFAVVGLGRAVVVAVIAVTMSLGSTIAASAVTAAATVCLIDSGGVGIEGAEARFHSGSWQTIGLTAADGCVSTDSQSAVGNTYFDVTYGGETRQTRQNTVVDPTVTFQTAAVTVELLNSVGTGIEGAPVRYYARGWKSFGTTDITGTVTRELLPANTYFDVTYGGETSQTRQNTVVDPTVTFQTGRVLQGTGQRVLSWAGRRWLPFVDGIELLPGNVTFALDDGSRTVRTVVAGSTIYVPNAPTAPVVSAGTDTTISEGDELVLNGVSFIDQESSQTHRANVDWGDGSATETATVVQSDGTAGTVSGSHTFTDDGTYTLTVCVTDDGNPDAEGCGSMLVTVTNVAPTIWAGSRRVS